MFTENEFREHLYNITCMHTMAADLQGVVFEGKNFGEHVISVRDQYQKLLNQGMKLPVDKDGLTILDEWLHRTNFQTEPCPVGCIQCTGKTVPEKFLIPNMNSKREVYLFFKWLSETFDPQSKRKYRVTKTQREGVSEPDIVIRVNTSIKKKAP